MEKTAQELAEIVGGEVAGDGSVKISAAATLAEATPGDISFVANPRYEKELYNTKASVVIVSQDIQLPAQPAEKPPKSFPVLIKCKDPYYAFMQIVVLLHGYREHEPVGISPNASVAESATIGKNVDIHDFVVISSHAKIGDNTRIYPSCTIGPGTTIGKDCIIYPNVTIYDGCTIGNNVTIHSGTVVGQDGFGYATHNGIHHKIPQIGGVIIEDDVEIGANCTIDRGTLGDTIIGQGTKMSNLIAIGHNAKIGPHCLLVAQVGIAGSTQVGPYCVFGGQVGVVGHIKIGAGVQIGAQAGVTNNIPEGQVVAGSPAMPITQAKRSLMMLKELPRFRKKMRRMEKSLEKLQNEEKND